MANRKSEKRERRVVSARQRVADHEAGSSLNTMNLPDGIPLFLVKKAGIYEVDILPFVVGKGNPFCKEVGAPHYERTFWIHRNIGADRGPYCCLSKTFKKPCPVCEFVAKEMRDPDHDPKYLKTLAPSERQLFLVIDLKDKDKGLQIFEYSHFLFGKPLDAKIRKYEDGRYDLFADLKEGLSLTLEFDEEKLPGFNPFYKCVGIEFSPRRKPYPESMLDENPCLDEVPRELKFKELSDIFNQSSGDEVEDEEEEDNDEEEVEEKPAAKRGRKPAPSEDEDEEEDGEDDDAGDDDSDEDEDEPTAEDKGIKVGTKVEHEDHGTCEVVHVSKDGMSLRLKDEDDEVHKGVAPSECEVVKKKKTEKTPAKKGGKKKPQVDEDEDENDDDPWQDD